MLLSAHRQAKGLTLAQCATELGLSAKSVGWLSDIENGKRDASLRLALRIERWSDGAVTAASVNAEIRATETGTNKPGLHGNETSEEDPTLVAPPVGSGAGNPDRNIPRTAVSA